MGQAKFTSPEEQKELGELNQFLSKFNIVVIPKAIQAPNKFSNFASAITNLITGVQVRASGITWAPSIISYGAVGLDGRVAGLLVAPAALLYYPRLVLAQASGVSSCHLSVSDFPISDV